jgi:hypothetical protein
VSAFLARQDAGDSSLLEIEDPRPLSFLSFGLGNRFDIGGTDVSPPGDDVAGL